MGAWWMVAAGLACGCGRFGFDPTGDGGSGDGGDGADGGTTGVAAQVAYLKANQINMDDSFGISVAISANGDTLAIGADGENSIATGINGDALDMTAQNAGAAYVFVRTGATWQQQAYVKASNTGANDRFGTTVALSADGNSLAVGATLEDGLAVDAGAVYIFRRSGTMWSEETRLKASNGGANDHFGIAIALSADGNTLAVGANEEDSDATGVNGTQLSETATDSGAVYVFVHLTTAWTQEAYLKASNTEAGDEFGVAVSLSDNGNTLVAGARDESSVATGSNGDGGNNGKPGSGAAYVFLRAGAAWIQQAYLKASNTDSGDGFGYSVGLSGDGNTLAVAAEDEASPSVGVNGDQVSNALFGAGAVYLFTRAAGAWSQQAYVKATNPSGMDSFGWNVALSATGDVLAVAAWREDGPDDSLVDSGALWTYRRSGTAWTPDAYVKASNPGASDRFATAIALSRDGTTVIAGAPTEDSDGVETNDLISDSGACYVFR